MRHDTIVELRAARRPCLSMVDQSGNWQAACNREFHHRQSGATKRFAKWIGKPCSMAVSPDCHARSNRRAAGTSLVKLHVGHVHTTSHASLVVRPNGLRICQNPQRFRRQPFGIPLRDVAPDRQCRNAHAGYPQRGLGRSSRNRLAAKWKFHKSPRRCRKEQNRANHKKQACRTAGQIPACLQKAENRLMPEICRVTDQPQEPQRRA